MSEQTGVSVAAMDALIKEMFELQGEIEQREAAITELNKKLAGMKAKGTEWLKELGRKNYKTDHGMLTIEEHWRFSLPVDFEAKKAMFSHFKKLGGEDLLYRFATVNSNSYNAFCKAEWTEAQQRGEGMEYRGPGGTEPKLHETVKMLKGKKA
jgi:hypothetical protein